MDIVSSAPKTRTLEDFDVNYINGATMSITVDKEAGDSYDFNSPTVAIFSLVERASPTSPDVIIPAEIITVFTRNVLAIQRWVRTIKDPTPEQKELWSQALKDFNGPRN